MAEYAYKPNAYIKTPAKVAGAIMEGLANTVGLTPKTLLDASRPLDAPLHGEFEWNDSVAAEQYRESQARFIIRITVVTREDKPQETTRAFVSIKDDGEKSPSYMSIDTVMGDDALREKLLASAKRDFEIFRTKYKQLDELADVFTAFDSMDQLKLDISA